jgi:antitoxin VapB
MALNIKNPETCELVQELAELNGESMTQAITNAVREELKRARQHKKKEGIAEKLMEIGRKTAPLIKEPWKSTPHGDLLYDENGMPK